MTADKLWAELKRTRLACHTYRFALHYARGFIHATHPLRIEACEEHICVQLRNECDTALRALP